MKKFLISFFVFGFYAFCVSADTSVTPSRVIPTQTEKVIVSRTAATRSVVKEPVVKTIDDSETNLSDATESDSTDSVKTKSVSRVAVSRSGMAGNNTENSRDKLENATRTVGRSSRTQNASINNTAAVKRAGITLRPTTAEVGGRATIGNTGVQTGSNLNLNNKTRSVSARAAATDNTAKSAPNLAANNSCQEQFNDCMDQFCSVINDNQKRCTCSANISKYEKVEAAVKDANTELNNVAQRIRYVGLSEEEIKAINTATEAEDVLDKTKDKTESRNMLEQIEDLIKDPSKVSSSSSGTTSDLDLDLNFTDDAGDLFSLDSLSGKSSSSFANLRGSDLYGMAKKRCKAVLTQCEKSGADSDQVVANYDLLIDKDCITYEQGLNKMNDTLKNNVRSATRMLQKARLAVLENQNEYDAKGCISALSECMSDDMVCGSNYAKCIDPTKQYIDENGEVVLGENISNIIAFMDQYNNALIDTEFLQDAYGQSITDENCKSNQNNNGTCLVKYLLTKIGTGDKITDGGLCRAVLDKCQQYTYDEDGNYQPYNDVVVNYIQRAMVNIQAAQRTIISDYAASCMTAVADCYNDQVSQVSSWSSSTNVDSVYKVMKGACRNVSLTCSYAIFANDTDSCPQTSAECTAGGNASVDCQDNNDFENICIESASTIFYQSLLCPDDSSYASTAGTASIDGTVSTTSNKAYVNDHCTCNSGYVSWDGECVERCNDGEYRSSTGTCIECDAGEYLPYPTVCYNSDIAVVNCDGSEGTVVISVESIRSCKTCDAGYYCPSDGMTAHTDCGLQNYCPTTGMTAPTNCASNTTELNAITCTP